jgi:pimeloyl-ACP methyl ester carboxylesterase
VCQLAQMRELVDYWLNHYDWRRFEARLNAFGQYRTQVDGLGIHFLHIRSKHPDALPMVMTHGWPGSVVEFVKLIEPLTDPTGHGGRAEEAFHIVIPSLPGFAFSDKPTTTGWNSTRIARAWDTLMVRLGYERYVAQGGDWGAVVTTALGQQQPKRLAGIHLNWAFVLPKQIPTSGLLPDQELAINQIAHLRDQEFGFYLEQSTRPQTIGYALSDSPTGLLAWIYEKFHAWTDPVSVLAKDQILDNIMLYWLTDAAAFSARIY